MTEFVPFPKIARLSRECIITEKIDGTNACVAIDEDGTIRAASRTRWITPQSDNFGFALWVEQNAEQLRELGPGRHFGEWWGVGIQRGYALHERRFSLFNVSKWTESRPACCHVVPTLWRGIFSTEMARQCVEQLSIVGSVAAPGYMKPEGIVVFHAASSTLYKKTCDADEQPKGKAA